jgi:histidinol-phosphate aminotransferase
MRAAMLDANRYPDAQALLDRLATHLHVPVASLVLGNGSIDLIAALVRLFVSAEHNIVLSQYGYSAYPAFGIELGAQLRIAPSGAHFGHDVDKLLAAVDEHTRMILIDTPTNLSGQAIKPADIARLIERLPAHVVLVLDEAYAEFVEPGDPIARPALQLPLRHPNVVVTRTFSKAYGLAGLRVGYAVADEGLLGYLNRVRPPFPVGGVALAGALAALEDHAHLQRIVDTARHGRLQLVQGLGAAGVAVVDGTANFLLADFGVSAKFVYEKLLAQGFITRAMHSYGLPTHIRISVGTSEENARLLDAIAQLLRQHEAPADAPAMALATS